MTKEDVKRIVLYGANGENSHCIIYCDHWDYEYASRFVKKGEDPREVIKDIKSFGTTGMYSIEEVYNYQLDLKSQLEERRAYHIEPLNIKKEEYLDGIEISPNLKKAIDYATKMHEGQKRMNGEPYINHPLRVMNNVLKYKDSSNLEVLLISACLHDTIEDTNATFYDIVNNFGVQVASIIMELTTDEDIKKELGKEKYLSIKMKNMSSWALVIKLCDRLDNVNDLFKDNDKDFINKYVNETIGIVDYLLQNAYLTNTHLKIIEDILNLLVKLSVDNNEKSEKLNNLIEKNELLKEKFNNKNNLNQVLSLKFYQ